MKPTTAPATTGQEELAVPIVRATILDHVTYEVVDRCDGSDEEGECTRRDEGPVPCAGRLLDATAPSVGWSLRLRIGSCATRCPLRGFRAEQGSGSD